ncbi:hypothetical protein CDL15_Pgr018639 [Punica granatum]|uniref:Gnk2-homologous domain-containing protein n=1 Tax=Punica granatum TaxID=22663 RepID=A0A218X0B0_PUNGR|nr:hypothetical protein CDL15_Pgr018639 [Punica granatum]
MARLQKIAIFTTAIFFIFCMVRGEPNTDEIYYHCNDNKFRYEDPYFESVKDVTNQVQDQTPSHGYDYYANSPGPYVCYGHGVCNRGLSTEDCSSCMFAARDSILYRCYYSYGAQVQLHDCRIRYEQYPFSE